MADQHDYVSDNTSSVSPKKDYSKSGPVWKDTTTKDLLKQLSDARTAFYLTLILFFASFSVNVILLYALYQYQK